MGISLLDLSIQNVSVNGCVGDVTEPSEDVGIPLAIVKVEVGPLIECRAEVL